jgi:hypothetical protein
VDSEPVSQGNVFRVGQGWSLVWRGKVFLSGIGWVYIDYAKGGRGLPSASDVHSPP